MQIGGANGYAEERWSNDPSSNPNARKYLFLFLMRYDTQTVA